MNREKATKFMHDLLKMLCAKGGSDLYIAAGAAPSIKVDGLLIPVSDQKLSAGHTIELTHALMTEKQLKEFEETNESNFAISLPGLSRFRVNAYIQRGSVAMVARVISANVPELETLHLPEILREIVMEKRGLVLIVGGTGSGKSTSLASMIDYRNRNSRGHIVTIEDPIEFVHNHKGCVVSQREVGTDTASWQIALSNTLRQAPDVVLIGEVRDAETMQHAISFAETGHLCLCTLHANNTNQAMDRVINFFPEEKRAQLLMDLSLNMRAIVSQRLIKMADNNGRRAAVEVLLNSPLMADLILKADVNGMKELIAKSTELGMRTFDQALFDLIQSDSITVDEALRNADSANNLRLRLKLEVDSGKHLSESADSTNKLKIQQYPD